jgi:hypothetical protein
MSEHAGLTRRRADTAHPYPALTVEEMTTAQRLEVQDALTEQFHGRRDRAAWDRRYWRSHSRPDYIYVRWRVLPLTRRIAMVGVLCWASGCATVPRVTSVDIVAALVQFHGAVAAQYAEGGMELEHFVAVTQWIGDEIRVVQANPRQWEGQARLDWPRVRSMVVPFERLGSAVQRLDALLQ